MQEQEQDIPISESTVVMNTPFDRASVQAAITSAIGAGAVTLVMVAGTLFVTAGLLNMVTFVIGGVASILLTVTPWVAVILGVCAFSAYAK